MAKLPAGPVHKDFPSVHKYHPLGHGNSFLSTSPARLTVGHSRGLTVMKTFALISIALGLPGKRISSRCFSPLGISILGLIGPLKRQQNNFPTLITVFSQAQSLFLARSIPMISHSQVCNEPSPMRPTGTCRHPSAARRADRQFAAQRSCPRTRHHG